MKPTFNIILAIIILISSFSCSKSIIKNSESREEKVYSTWMASSEIKRNPEGWTLDFNTKPKWEYTHGLVMMAMFQVWERTSNEEYLNYIKNFTDFMIDPNGKILTYKKTDYNIDRVNGGKYLIDLYQLNKSNNLLTAIEELRDQMRNHPRNSENGFWHKKIYPHQMWLDGIYMGTPFLAKYAFTFGEEELFEDVVNQILLMDKYSYNNDSGLFHHAYDESKSERWADPQSGLSTNYWGRSIGWYAMALVDVLDYLPKNHPDRPKIIAICEKLAKGITKYQHESGTWYQIVDQGNREGNYLEASASSMFAYFLLKGVQKGYLPKEYQSIGLKAYNGIIQEFIREDKDRGISLIQICGVAGLGGTPYRDGSYEYYINEIIRENDPKGVGPFILASLIFENMNK